MMISSTPPRSTSCFTAAYGSLSPMPPSTCPPAASSSSGRASSSVLAASSVSGSQYGLGTSRVKLHGDRRARARSSSSSSASPQFGQPPPGRAPAPATSSRHDGALLPTRSQGSGLHRGGRSWSAARRRHEPKGRTIASMCWTLLTLGLFTGAVVLWGGDATHNHGLEISGVVLLVAAVIVGAAFG